MLHMRDDAFGVLGDTDLADGTVEGAAPAFTVNTVDEFTPGEDAEIARRIARHLHRALLPVARAATRAGTSRSTATGCRSATATGPPTSTASSRARPSTAGARRPGAPGDLRPRPLRRRGGGVQRPTSSGPREPSASSSARPTRSGCRAATSPTRRGDPARPLQLPAARRPPAAGAAERALPRPADDPPRRLRQPRAFHVDGATLGTPSVIDDAELYYIGASQGGIMGGALTAIAPDFTRRSSTCRR